MFVFYLYVIVTERQLQNHFPPPSFQSNTTTIIDAHPTLTAQLRKKSGRAGSMETDPSGSTGSSSSDTPTPGQVAAISSTDGLSTSSSRGSAAGGAAGTAGEGGKERPRN